MFDRIVIVLALCAFGCSSDPANSGTPDSGNVPDVATTTPDVGDSGVDGRDAAAPDVAEPEDTGETREDTGQPNDAGDTGEADVSNGGGDTGDGTDTGDGADTGNGTDPYAGRPDGQCATTSDCPSAPSGPLCSAALPGGACLGCGNDSHCPSGTSCVVGTCVTDCDDDNDCPPGLQCLGGRRCAAVPCVAGACPIPLFGCSASDLCARVDCSGDAAACPADTTCNGSYCIEDRVL